jgi:hypothetical protein
MILFAIKKNSLQRPKKYKNLINIFIKNNFSLVSKELRKEIRVSVIVWKQAMDK